MAARQTWQDIEQRASKYWFGVELEDALRLRTDPEVEFPTERVVRGLENAVRGNRCVGASAPVDVGQVRLLSGRRLFVLVVENLEGDFWLCMPIHHHRRLKGPGDVELARDCYVEAWQSLIVPTPMLVPYGMRIPVVSKKRLQEARVMATENRKHIMLRKGGGAVAIFRAAEIQYVMLSILALPPQEQASKRDKRTL